MEVLEIKTYDKEKIGEYINYLATLCNDKNLRFNHSLYSSTITVMIGLRRYIGVCYTSTYNYSYKGGSGSFEMPIWELIEKVKQL